VSRAAVSSATPRTRAQQKDPPALPCGPLTDAVDAVRASHPLGKGLAQQPPGPQNPHPIRRAQVCPAQHRGKGWVATGFHYEFGVDGAKLASYELRVVAFCDSLSDLVEGLGKIDPVDADAQNVHRRKPAAVFLCVSASLLLCAVALKIPPSAWSVQIIPEICTQPRAQ